MTTQSAAAAARLPLSVAARGAAQRFAACDQRGDGVAAGVAIFTVRETPQHRRCTMPIMKTYPCDLAAGVFDVVDDAPLPQITRQEQAVVDAATQSARRYYQQNPDAEEIDKRLNSELRAMSRRAHPDAGCPGR